MIFSQRLKIADYLQKTAIVGLGGIAHIYEEDPLVRQCQKYSTHFRAISDHPAFELVAGCDIDENKRKRFNNKSGVETFNNLDDMFNFVIPDVLVVATAGNSHREIIDIAISYEIKCIFCEKPLAYSIEDGEHIVKRISECNTTLFVNYMRAFSSQYEYLIRECSLGHVQGAHSRYCRGILNNGTHLINLMSRMFGKIIGVRGYKNSICRDEKDPSIDAQIEFSNGLLFYLHGCEDYFDVFDLDILFTQGKLIMDNDKVHIYKHVPSSRIKGYYEIDDVGTKIDAKIGESLYDAYTNIDECLNNKSNNPKCSGHDALISLKIAVNAIRSAEYNSERILV